MKKHLSLIPMVGKFRLPSVKLIPSLSFLLVIFSLLLASCNNNQAEVERLEQENLALQAQMENSKENVENYFSDLNEIEQNLRLIKETESLISRQAVGDLELGTPQKDLINEDIKLIGELMEKNRILIAGLNNRIRNSDTRIKGFEESVMRLNKTIQEKEVEISLLRDQLGSMNLRVDLLTAKLDTLEMESLEKNRRLEEQTLEMNTAYYAVGSRRELTDNNIISREGGFLGLGRSDKLKDDFNLDFFTRVDIKRVNRITINGEKPEVITVHPTESYQFDTEEGELYLTILKPESFWLASRYLVVEVR